MSYIRGRYYTWQDGKKIHLSNDIIPLIIFDELVVMRYSQLEQNKNKLQKLEKKTIKKYAGNLGCDLLCKKYGQKTVMELAEEIVLKKKLNKNNGNNYN